MLPKTHVIFGLVFAVFFFLLFPSFTLIGALIFFLASFTIDIDHYFEYVLRKKDYNLKKAIKWQFKMTKKFLSLPIFKRKKIFQGINIFHGIEPLLIALMISLIFPIFFYIFLGMALHFILDLIHGFFIGKNLSKLSLVYVFYLSKKYPHIEKI